ncbi:signal-induced proliferation-associated 1-like protein 2 isoform X2 [Protopterus annectens]|nr:signal-induced proliferation-associated 1-like protein 2 isoform X2 [Protopterus annectens]
MQSDDLFIRKFRRPYVRPALTPSMFEPRGTRQGGEQAGLNIHSHMVQQWTPKKDCNDEVFSKVGGRDISYNRGMSVPVDCDRASPKSVLRSSGRSYFMQRSNSDVTIGEVEVDGTASSSLGTNREFGSLSSIEKPPCSPRSRTLSNEETRTTSPAALRFKDPFLLLGLPAEAQDTTSEVQELPPESPSEKTPKVRTKMEKIENLAVKKLKTQESDQDLAQYSVTPDTVGRNWVKIFAHYDVQSILFNLHEVESNRNSIGKLKNIATGASAASQNRSHSPSFGSSDSPVGSTEDLHAKENMVLDEGDGKDNELVLSCHHFRNEIGGEKERCLSQFESVNDPEMNSFEPGLVCQCPNAAISVLEAPRESQIEKHGKANYFIEYADLGATYYQKYLYKKEHQNFFGIDDRFGPVAISIRREEKEGAGISQYIHRLIFRTTELKTLRGSIPEEALPSAARHATPRGVSPKKLLEHVIPELNVHCLRLASNSPKVPETLRKLDEQGLNFQRKIGIMYCKAGQSTEEEMYNNENADPPFQEFMDLIGEKVRLKGFEKYRAQLDNKTDSTGTHSLYTTYQDYEIMFHVSTMLPYTSSNRQQLLRKRHIGNDIVTIVFQEPGALPFTAKTIRSQFQHVFIIVQVQNPCTPQTTYKVAVSRTKDIPPFGPFIPKENVFPKSATFRDFLLAKAINAENAAEKSEKFYTMATRTRQEYLKDLATNCVTTTTIDSSTKFTMISLGVKKKEKSKVGKGAELYSGGAIVWNVMVRDVRRNADLLCLLGISFQFLILIEQRYRRVVFNCSCQDVLAWTFSETTMDVFYGKGGYISLKVAEGQEEDIKEIVQRLQIVTRGCETRELTLLRNGVGQLGFQVDAEGIVTEVEKYSFAETSGLQIGARIVRVCEQPVISLTHPQMMQLLRTAVKAKITVIPPEENGKPRRSFSELYLKSIQEKYPKSEITVVEPKNQNHADETLMKPQLLQLLRAVSLQEPPKHSLPEERTEFLRSYSDKVSERSKCQNSPLVIDSTPDVILTATVKPNRIQGFTAEKLGPLHGVQQDQIQTEAKFFPAERSQGSPPALTNHNDHVSTTSKSTTPEVLNTGKCIPGTTLDIRTSLTKMLENSEAADDEWQTISELYSACSSILEALNKEGKTLPDQVESRGEGSSMTSHRDCSQHEPYHE